MCVEHRLWPWDPTASEPCITTQSHPAAEHRAKSRGVAVQLPRLRGICKANPAAHVQPESADDAAPAEGEEAAEGEETPQVHWKGAGKQSAIFTFDAPGEGSITARWMGQEVVYAVKVVPAPAQP